jgi:uncharacterized protein YijF (DUF1287 family)
MFKRVLLTVLLFIALLVAAIWAYRHLIQPPAPPSVLIPAPPPLTTPTLPPVLRPTPPAHVAKMLGSLTKQVAITRSYDPSYVNIPYPGGDVKGNTGVCADVIVRAFRAQGIDLQREVHEDMAKNFSVYPKKWGMKRPDTNIDHRRVYNLMAFFERKGKSLPITHNPDDYLPGDVVAWDLGEGQGHIGIVTEYKTPDGIPVTAHNVGYGTNMENALFFWPIIGHYRYFNAPADVNATRPGHTTTALQQSHQ